MFDFSHFRPTLAVWLTELRNIPPIGQLRAYLTSKSYHKGTNWATWFGKSTFWGLCESGGVVGEKIENLTLKSGFEAVFDFKIHLFLKQFWTSKLICVIKYVPIDLLTMIYTIM